MGYGGKSCEGTGGKSATSPSWRKEMGAELLEKGWLKSKGTGGDTVR